MRPNHFAVSVQWGEGMHYFRSFDLASYGEAEKLAKAILTLELAKKKKAKMNLKPVVHIWQHWSALSE